MTTSERRIEREAGETALAKRISTIRPQAVIVVMRGIGPHVRRALAAAELQNTPVYEVSFPAMGHQTEYVRDLAAILRSLRRTGVLDRSIAILGWGSLIWEPGDLHFDGEWWPDGPILPIEISRKSERRQNALTLVLHSEAVRLPVLWAVSRHDELEMAIENLKIREGTAASRIGFVSLRDGSSRSQVIAETAEVVRRWSQEKGLKATIWTDLASNFEGGFGKEVALAHIRNLNDSGKEAARHYILNTPPQIQTRLRRSLTRELTGD